MAASIRWDGLDEFLEELRRMPETLRDESGHIIGRVAGDAAQDIRGVYQAHRRSGNLAEHVKVETTQAGPFGVAVRVRSTARHAWLFDHGSQVRHYITRRGTRHLTGKMPPTFAFIRSAIRHRRRMYEELRQLLLKHGATRVEGEP